MKLHNKEPFDLEKRPDRLPMTSVEWALSVCALLILAASAGEVILRYGALPQVIPTHYGLDGLPNDWGNRSSLLGILAADAACVLVGFVCNFFPQHFNIPYVAHRRPIIDVLHVSRLLLEGINICVAAVFAYLIHVTLAGLTVSNGVVFGLVGLMAVMICAYFIYLMRGR